MKVRRVRFDVRRQGKPLLLVLLGVLVLNTAAWFFLVRPKVRDHSERSQGSGPKIEALQRQRAGVEQGEAYVQALQQAEGDLDYLRKEVLSTRDARLVMVQRELARLCKEFRIDLESVSNNNEILTDEGIDRFAMVVPLEGGYNNLRKFLQAVESSERFMVVERVALDEGRVESGTLQLSITLATYFDLVPEEPQRPREPGRGRT